MLKASRKRRIAAGSGTKPEDINKLLKMHRTMADMMKAMGGAKRGPMAGLANMLGSRRRHAEPGRDGEARRENAGRLAGAGMPGAPVGLPPSMPGLPPNFPGRPEVLPGSAAKLLPAAAAFPGSGKKMMRHHIHIQTKGN